MGEYLHKEYEEEKEGSGNFFLKNIFSFVSLGQTHYMIKFLGFKIKILKPEVFEQKKENKFYYYKKNNVEITTLPPASGKIRDIQLANLTLLNELDYVCQKSGLKYWIDGGTLLGAVRHKGFIPWDDDIDTSMLREDYNQIIDAFKQYSRNPDIYADYYRSKVNSGNCYVRVFHKKCKHLFVDIFPWDNYGKVLTQKEQIKESSKIIKLRKKLEKQCDKNVSNETVKAFVAELRAKILQGFTEDCLGDFVWGVDFFHPWKNWFTSKEVLFPLKTIDFEGKQYSCINNPDAFLTRVYGKYMDYPAKLTCAHSMFVDFSEEDRKNIAKIKEEGLNG